MSDHASDDEQRPVAPGIAAAMRNVRNADQLSERHRHRWSLPSDREEPTEDASTDEVK